ncbi:Hypothetical protein PHPALM_297 [Phytophthora palmivora]|uniref:Uncharacterized protein n=1 Tax=Phytophthora palmivora TaxID=4796 RepID=A0A2P4YV53_9STRA|nr:Hypothetical protein PHPALM_297 [Phytophthora palmivora]
MSGATASSPGYTATDTTDILHILNADGPTRFPLTNVQSVIKLGALNYALRPGQGFNVTALSATELLHQQDAACRKKRSGIPAAVMASLSTPFSPSDIVSLVKPSTLQLVHVHRQHIVDFSTAPRTARPEDLYTDTVPPSSAPVDHTDAAEPATTPRRRRRTAQAAPQQMNLDSSDEEDSKEVRQMNTPLLKRRRCNDDDISSDSSEAPFDRRSRTQRGIVFHPSRTDRHIHAAIIRHRHKGKVPQTLLQTIQQSSRVDFLVTPAVLRGQYSFGFGLGLSIDDYVTTSEKGVNLWDLSSKNGYPTPLQVTSYADLISALTTLYKFSQHFYNSEMTGFISTTKDFVIQYAAHARDAPTMARLLAFWVNEKFSLFRNIIIWEGLKEAMTVSVQFSRSDDKPAVLREPSSSWKQTASLTRFRTVGNDQRRFNRVSSSSRIPPDVYSQLPLGKDDRKTVFEVPVQDRLSICKALKFSFSAGVTNSKKEIPHFRTWGVLGTPFVDL